MALQGEMPEFRDLALRFEQFLDQQVLLCHELESIADGLPGIPDMHGCLDLARRMLLLIKSAHHFEESHVWSAVVQADQATADMPDILNRLSFEHWGDEDFAEQVFHLLREYVRSPSKEMADGLAWTLRGFFQNMQRHIAFERAVILPIIAGAQSTQANGL